MAMAMELPINLEPILLSRRPRTLRHWRERCAPWQVRTLCTDPSHHRPRRSSSARRGTPSTSGSCSRPPGSRSSPRRLGTPTARRPHRRDLRPGSGRPCRGSTCPGRQRGTAWWLRTRQTSPRCRGPRGPLSGRGP
uniref:Uncharacterized protein n=1 Tax=Arundo donax TaxID=35708 RepID=A0A0A9FYT4_ARUDO